MNYTMNNNSSNLVHNYSEGYKVMDHRKEFMDLFGVWTEENMAEFSRAVQDFEEIDEGEW